MKIDTDIKKIDEILERGVGEAINKEELRKLLSSGKSLRIKLGIDPTSPNIHIGRAATLLKLKDLQDLGHQIIFIIGDFTGVIGDTSDKNSERPMLSKSDIKKNMKTYFVQAGKILNMRSVEKEYNSKWLKKLGYAQIGEQADQFSVADFIARDNIRRRLDAGKRVSLREVLYPLMQGYDSVEVKADVEIGGTDQRFNLLAGRSLQPHYGQMPQSIIMLELILGTDGRKMSSSWGNTINITDSPENMYGKVMSIRDSVIIQYFISCTRVAMEEVRVFELDLKNENVNPRDIKMRLAREIVAVYYKDKEVKKAEELFVKTFQKKESPENAKTVKVAKGSLLADVLISEGLISSKNGFRTLVTAGAIKKVSSSEIISDYGMVIEVSMLIKVGKRRFLNIEVV